MSTEKNFVTATYRDVYEYLLVSTCDLKIVILKVVQSQRSVRILKLRVKFMCLVTMDACGTVWSQSAPPQTDRQNRRLPFPYLE